MTELLLAQSEFTGTHHLWSLGVFAAVMAAMIVSGRRSDRATRRVMAGFGFAVWLLSSIYYLLPANIEPDKSLPIQACDILGLLAPIYLLLPSRWLQSVVYFGGFGLTTQAFVTPVVDTGPDTLVFWIFWLLHGVILAASIYIVAVEGFRPAFKDYRNAVAVWCGYALAMVALNFATHAAGLNNGDGWYYGYLGPSIPDEAADSVLKFLGPWPVRPLAMMGLALGFFTLLYVPWLLVPKRKETV